MDQHESPFTLGARHALSNVGDELLTGPLLSGWFVPKVLVLDGDRIRYRKIRKDPGKRVSPPEAGLAGEFINLGHANPEKILGFARRFGVLGVHKDGLPWLQEDHWEPLSLWRSYADGLRALLQIGIELRKGLYTVEPEWKAACLPILCPGPDPSLEPWNAYFGRFGPESNELITQRWLFATLTEAWIKHVRIIPTLDYEIGVGVPTLVLTQGSLLESVVALSSA